MADEARRDEEGDGIDREDAERVDLLGDDHGPELGGVVGADAAVIISAVSSGAISRSVPKPAPQPSRPSAPKRFTSGAAWMTMMAPVKSAVTTTMGIDLTPIL